MVKFYSKITKKKTSIFLYFDMQNETIKKIKSKQVNAVVFLKLIIWEVFLTSNGTFYWDVIEWTLKSIYCISITILQETNGCIELACLD